MKKTILTSLILLTFLISVANAEQINPRVQGEVNLIEKAGDYYVIGGGDILYVFEKNGKLKGFLSLDGISDFEVTGDTLIVTTYSKEFPNVRAYSFPSLELLWSFQPEMSVFDPTLVWHKVQPRTWCVKIFDDKIGVCSGYNFYLMDKDGNLLGRFEADNDIWDAVKTDRYYLASQDGNIYILDDDLNLVERKKICDEFVLRDPLTNNTKGIYSRSVWQLEELGDVYAACEDGNVYVLTEEGIESIEVEGISESLLTSYYMRIKRETSFGDQNFRNLKMMKTGNGLLVYTSNNVGFIKDGKQVWNEYLKPEGEGCIHDDMLYLPKKYGGGRDFVYVYSLGDGEKEDEMVVDSVPCASKRKLFCDDDGILLASACEIKFMNYEGNVSWSFPRIGTLEPVKVGNKLILLADTREAIIDTHRIYYVMAIGNNTLLWEYVPSGYIKDVSISDKRVALAVSSDEGDKIVVIDIENGDILFDGPPTQRVYAGVLDEYLLDQSLINTLRDFDFSVLDGIPEEVLEGRIDEAVRNYGMDSVREWLNRLSDLPVEAETLWKFRSIDLNNLKDLKLRRVINRIDTCDLNGDGEDDILVSAEDYLVLLDGKTLKEEWLVDSRDWRYRNDFNRDYYQEFVRDWYDNDYMALCAGDVNRDGKEDLFLYRHERYKLLESSGNTYKERWSSSIENLIWESVRLIDMDNDDSKEILIGRWRRNQPDLYEIRSVKYNTKIADFSGDRKIFFRFNLRDFNGDGRNESVVVYVNDGMKIKVFSKGYEWTYEDIREFWDVWNRYRYVMPVESDDDILIGIKKRDDQGIKLIRMDVKENKAVETLDIEPSRGEFYPRDWSPFVDMMRDGDVVFMAIPEMSWRTEKGRMIAYDMEKGKLKATLYDDVRRILKVGGSIVFLTVDGKIITLPLERELNVRADVDGDVKLSWDTPGHSRIYINDVLAASLDGNGASLRLSDGEYEIRVSLLNEDGYEYYGYVRVNVFNPSNLFIFNIILGILIGAVIGVKIWLRR